GYLGCRGLAHADGDRAVPVVGDGTGNDVVVLGDDLDAVDDGPLDVVGKQGKGLLDGQGEDDDLALPPVPGRVPDVAVDFGGVVDGVDFNIGVHGVSFLNSEVGGESE